MAEQLVALCRIEHDGKTYNYGDVVPAAVIAAHPTAVGDRPLTADAINEMNADELRAALLKASGNPEPEAAPVSQPHPNEPGAAL